MRKSNGIAYLFIPLLLYSCQNQTDSSWKIAENTMLTQWSSKVNSDMPWTEYPRPIMERDNWINLNGVWDYAITESGSRPEKWEGKILVPYPVQSVLSGVGQNPDESETLWYRRFFKVPSDWKDKRIKLNFEASDWETTIYIDGTVAGNHKGGYDPFTVDLTQYVIPGRKHELTVSVWDPTDLGSNPRGKQVTNPRGIWYTPVTGIWQTVWLEPVTMTHFGSLKITTDLETGKITIVPKIINAKDDISIIARVLSEGKLLYKSEVGYDKEIELTVSNFEPWSPSNPVLYDLELIITDEEKILDQVKSYTGFRKVSLGKTADGFTRILLNNEFVFQNGPLDQGFWPDGIYTPPTEEAMVYDLKMIKSMGFNMLRKHVKIENRRFYYWCDKLGLLVWQDMPSGDKYIGSSSDDIEKDPEDRVQFEIELRRMIETKYNHPSIIIWVPFNEGWGQFNTGGITDLIKAEDPTRLVNSASGWTDRGTGDIKDVHHYPEPVCPEAEESRAIVLGEFGGLGLPIKDHTWEQTNWGYQNMISREELLEKYEIFYNEVHRMVKSDGLSASVYTQITDVETETNGLISYDRYVDKMGFENVARANMGMSPPALTSNRRIFIDKFIVDLRCEKEEAVIFYTTDGSEPERNSNRFISPFEVDRSIALKVIAFWPDGKSRIRSYMLDKKAPLESLKVENPSPGLIVSRYIGEWDKIPVFDSLEAIKDSIAYSISIPANGFDSNFGLNFEGYVLLKEDGVYGFHLNSDDGSRLKIDGSVLIENEGIHGMIERSGYVALKSGYHQVEVEYFQRGGGKGLELIIENNKGIKRLLPPDYLFH